jgi:succinate dehydrogenase/fumarate reductase flavoprotein subunit
MKKRKVFLDFRKNPLDEDIDFSLLSRETREYLEQAQATSGTPLDRLLVMNNPAYEFYKGRGVDLKDVPLEIALCAQHNNGGLAVDEWWKTNVEGFFAAGEVAGSHGVYRPGGSALNAGQVGSMRAAQYIAKHRAGSLEDMPDDYFHNSLELIRNRVLLSTTAMSDESNVMQLLENAQNTMSEIGASIRDVQKIEWYLDQLTARLKGFGTEVRIRNISQFSNLYRLHDVYLAQYVYLHAMIDYQKKGGRSRGSAMYHDAKGTKVFEEMDETFRFLLDDHSLDEMIQEIELTPEGAKANWRKREPLPMEEDFFENVWKTYRENENIY